MVDDVIDGIKAAKGTTVFVCPWALHRQPDLWPNPNRIDPERFLGAQARDKFAYIPFGAGPRVCIGQHLAMYELQAMALAFCGAFDIVPVGQDISEMRAYGGITLGHPQEGLKVRLFTRSGIARREAA